MRNTIKLLGDFLEVLPVIERDEFTVRLHSDVSFDNQGETKRRKERHIIGYGYCIELSPFAPVGALPAYGLGTFVRNVNYCSATAELMGILHALRETELDRDLEILCDNRDAINILSHVFIGHRASEFQVTHGLREVIRQFEPYKDRNITARWVRGHAGNLYNHAVDELARIARKTREKATQEHYIARRIARTMVNFQDMHGAE